MAILLSTPTNGIVWLQLALNMLLLMMTISCLRCIATGKLLFRLLFFLLLLLHKQAPAVTASEGDGVQVVGEPAPFIPVPHQPPLAPEGVDFDFDPDPVDPFDLEPVPPPPEPDPVPVM
jgi:hypothetical protein